MRVRKAFEEDLEEIVKIKNGKYIDITKERLEYFSHLLKNVNLHVLETDKIIGFFAYEEIPGNPTNIEEFDILDEFKTKEVFDLVFGRFKDVSHYVNQENKIMIEFLKENNFKIKDEYYHHYKSINDNYVLSKIHNFINSANLISFFKPTYRFAEEKDLNFLVKIRNFTPEFNDELKNIKSYYEILIKKKSIFISEENNQIIGYIVFNYIKPKYCNLIDLVVIPEKRRKRIVIYMLLSFISELWSRSRLISFYGMILKTNQKMNSFSLNFLKTEIEGEYYLMNKY